MCRRTSVDVYSEWLGIPDGPRPPDHYTLLRLVQFEDDAAKIRKNYRTLNAHVRKYATGKYSVQSQELLNELARVMLVLTDPERKREYDESQGREFEDDGSGQARSTVEALVTSGVLSRAQAREAEEFAAPRGLSQRDAVVQLKMCSLEQATMAYAEELQRPFVDLSEMTPDDDMLDLFPRQFVKRNRILPLFADDDMLLVACVEEPDHELEDQVR
ncbi:MAG: general secretion pathway protein GspE, partial [Planctomycetaceae bacterium]|nr:general secretion pathway protein GspE [Planctomycetaceae bacterium]